jgi:hypothetical protein
MLPKTITAKTVFTIFSARVALYGSEENPVSLQWRQGFSQNHTLAVPSQASHQFNGINFTPFQFLTLFLNQSSPGKIKIIFFNLNLPA